MTDVTRVDVLAAQEAIRPWIGPPTPVERCAWLSEASGADVLLKLDLFREARTFKVRGAVHALLRLGEARRRAGVVTASGGNHGLAVAFAAHRLGAPAVIVMTERAPANIADMCRAYGARVVIHGSVYDESEERARALAASEGKSFIPAFDDPDIVAGQGTLGLELQEQVPGLDAVLVPVGGGGLIAGVAASFPNASRPLVVGAEPVGGAALRDSLAAGRSVRVEKPDSAWAEKLIPKEIGALPLAISRERVARVVAVEDRAIEDAVLSFLRKSNLLVEGSAAITAAALLQEKSAFAGQRVALVLSGGNVNWPLLTRALARA